SGALAPLERSRCGLPGIAAALEAVETVDAYGQPFALLHHPRAGHVTVVLSTSPDGVSLVDAEQSDQMVARWGVWLAGLAYEPDLVAASVTIESAPDSGSRLRREI